MQWLHTSLNIFSQNNHTQLLTRESRVVTHDVASLMPARVSVLSHMARHCRTCTVMTVQYTVQWTECYAAMGACHIMWPTWHSLHWVAKLTELFSCGGCSQAWCACFSALTDCAVWTVVFSQPEPSHWQTWDKISILAQLPDHLFL